MLLFDYTYNILSFSQIVLFSSPVNNIVTVIFRSHTVCKANRDRRLDNYYRIRIILNPCHIISLTHPFSS